MKKKLYSKNLIKTIYPIKIKRIYCYLFKLLNSLNLFKMKYLLNLPNKVQKTTEIRVFVYIVSNF